MEIIINVNRALQLILCLFFLTISCKKNTSISDKSTLKSYNSHNNQTDNKIENTNDSSFVLSCGSGCAMRYTSQSIQQNNSTVNVKFKVENYINEKLSDTYYEKYNFTYNSSGEIQRINLEGESDNILETLMPDAQESFRNFSKDLIKNKKVDVSKFSKVSDLTIKNDFKICSLPFDSDKYYSLCNENETECNQRYPSYLYPENKKILENYGIKEYPSKFFILPKINNFKVIILAFTDSDIEGYYLKVIDKNEIISSLQIAKMDGETIDDFLITENYEIELYTRRDVNEKKLLKKKYKIQNDGMIVNS